MASREELYALIEQLAKHVVEAPDKFTASQQNEEWTKFTFIHPLIQRLGWRGQGDVSFEVSSEDSEGFLDYVLTS